MRVSSSGLPWVVSLLVQRGTLTEAPSRVHLQLHFYGKIISSHSKLSLTIVQGTSIQNRCLPASYFAYAGGIWYAHRPCICGSLDEAPFQVSTAMEAIGDITASAEVSRLRVEGDEFDSRVQGGILVRDYI